MPITIHTVHIAYSHSCLLRQSVVHDTQNPCKLIKDGPQKSIPFLRPPPLGQPASYLCYSSKVPANVHTLDVLGHTKLHTCTHMYMSRAQKVRNHIKIGQVPCADTQGISTRVVMEGVHIIRHACTLYNTCSNVPARAVFADAEVLPRATSSMLPVIHSFKPRYKSICI